MPEPVYRQDAVELYHGDCLDVLRDMPAGSVHAMVTDPPAGVAFMNKKWDHDRGGRDQWVAWLTERMTEAYRALKPGAHALVWGLPRTSHWTAWALEDAGFEIRDCVVSLFGTGFPKSVDVSKAIDRLAGVERDVVGIAHGALNGNGRNADYGAFGSAKDGTYPVTAPATDAAREWDGYGTALKPAAEYWRICRKPIKGTIAANVLEHGVGALNIDACRVPGVVPQVTQGVTRASATSDAIYGGGKSLRTEVMQSNPHSAGRWPPNAVFTHQPLIDPDTGDVIGDACADGCVEGCPVLELDHQTIGMRCKKPAAKGSVAAGGMWGIGGVCNVPDYGDSGSPARFFPTFRYQAKAPTSERPKVNGTAHPTVKSLNLTRWLCKLITPPNGVILDPFCGTGTTGEAARAEGFRAILIDSDPQSIAWSVARLSGAPVS